MQRSKGWFTVGFTIIALSKPGGFEPFGLMEEKEDSGASDGTYGKIGVGTITVGGEPSLESEEDQR